MPSAVDPSALDRATEAFFGAAIDPDLWPSVLATLSDAAASTGVVLFQFDGRDRSSWMCNDRCAGSVDEYLASDWVGRNPRLERPPPDTIQSDADYLSDERQARDLAAFREGFLRKRDMGWFAGTSLFRHDDRQVLISAERSFRIGAFDETELRMLSSAFARMRQITALVPSLDARLRMALLDGFEGRGQATAIVDRSGRLLDMNRAAELLLPTVLRVRRGHLRAVSSAQSAAWMRFLDKLISPGPTARRFPEPVLLTSDQGVQLVLRGSPLPANANALFQGSSALVFFDKMKGPPPSQVLLRSLVGLTSTEARLAAELASRFDLRQAAEVLGMQHETARSHLKRIFAKTETGNQAECIAKLLKLS